MPTTPVLALPYPLLADQANVPVDMQELCDRLEAVLTGTSTWTMGVNQGGTSMNTQGQTGYYGVRNRWVEAYGFNIIGDNGPMTGNQWNVSVPFAARALAGIGNNMIVGRFRINGSDGSHRGVGFLKYSNTWGVAYFENDSGSAYANSGAAYLWEVHCNFSYPAA